MWYRAKFVKLRKKSEADEFIEYLIEEGDTHSENYYLPEVLSGKVVKVEFALWKKEKKILVVSTKEWWGFYKVHPSSVGFKWYYAKSFEDIENEL